MCVVCVGWTVVGGGNYTWGILMKIVLASESYWPMIDGGAVAEHNLCLELARRGHDVHILAPGSLFKDEDEKNQGTLIHRLASVTTPLLKNKHRFAWRPRKKIQHIIESLKPDVIHIHNPFGIGQGALAAAQKYDIPTVATNHWLPENMTTFMTRLRIMNHVNFLVKFNWWYINHFHNQCDFTTAPTQTAIDLMTHNGLKAPHRPVSNGVNPLVFHPGIDAVVIRKKYGIPSKPTALYTGRLSGEKYVDTLISAIPQVLAKVDAHFVIGGNGIAKPLLETLAKKLGIDAHVTFTGFIDEPEFPQIYNAADVFVMPSICELQSITTLEAMASGLPVIAANKYALPELVKHKVNGFLFDPFNSQELAERLIDLFQNPEKRIRMGQESLQIVAPHALSRTVDQYEEIYGIVT